MDRHTVQEFQRLLRVFAADKGKVYDRDEWSVVRDRICMSQREPQEGGGLGKHVQLEHVPDDRRVDIEWRFESLISKLTEHFPDGYTGTRWFRYDLNDQVAPHVLGWCDFQCFGKNKGIDRCL